MLLLSFNNVDRNTLINLFHGLQRLIDYSVPQMFLLEFSGHLLVNECQTQNSIKFLSEYQPTPNLFNSEVAGYKYRSRILFSQLCISL